MILLFQTLASAFLSTLFFVPELLDYPKRNVCGQSQNNEQGKVGRSVLLINLFQLHYATDRAHNEPLGLFCVFWPSTRVQ